MPRVTAGGGRPEVSYKTLQIDRFLGVDLTNGIAGVDMRRSPDARNVQPDLDGFPVKRKGYQKVFQMEGKVNGAYLFVKGEAKTRLLHSGTGLYRITEGELPEKIYADMADEKSRAVQLEEKLLIADGKRLLCYADFDGTGVYTLRPADECGTTPLISIGRKPDGSAAKSYNPPNLLSAFVKEDFLADGAAKAYQLSYPELPDTDEVTVEQRGTDGIWKKTEAAAYTVDREAGVITFKAAPAKPAAAGEDNVRVTYPKKRDPDPVNRCRRMVLYGVSGQPDRVWLAGNEEKKNHCRYSQFRDPLYFGDVWYAVIGQEAAPVLGFAILGNKLAVYKNGEEHERNVFLLSGQTNEEGEAVFPVYDVLQGAGITAADSPASLLGEPLFLSERGVEALAQADGTSQRYLQNRSFYLNGALTREKGLENAQSAVWGRFYLLAVNGRVYLLDGNQKSYEANSPHSAYQYEGYVWDGIAAERLWTYGEELWFGDGGGGVYRFCTGEASSAYMDDGRAIEACWTTPLMNLGSWTSRKTVSDVWVVTKPYPRSGAELYYATDREYEEKAKSFNTDIFNWNDIDFDRFTFNTMDRPAVSAVKRKAKKVKLFQVRVKNAREREPFGLFAVCIRYRTGGKIKA
ncbi:MAG: hypothetical protein Q4G07_08610 [Oscillospiraceae bacterium]|nr:hypothetical protein [Oscillospiraceae bacterium]